MQGGHHAQGQVQGATPVVAHQVQWRHGFATCFADRVQRAGQCDVVQVVARRMRQRALLAEAGHTAIHKTGVMFVAGRGAKAQPFGHTRAKSLDQHIGAGHQLHQGSNPAGRLKVQCDRTAAACVHVKARRQRQAQAAGLGAVDAHDIGAQVGQQHAAHRRRADTGEFDHLQSVQRSHAPLS